MAHRETTPPEVADATGRACSENHPLYCCDGRILPVRFAVRVLVRRTPGPCEERFDCCEMRFVPNNAAGRGKEKLRVFLDRCGSCRC